MQDVSIPSIINSELWLLDHYQLMTVASAWWASCHVQHTEIIGIRINDALELVQRPNVTSWNCRKSATDDNYPTLVLGSPISQVIMTIESKVYYLFIFNISGNIPVLNFSLIWKLEANTFRILSVWNIIRQLFLIIALIIHIISGTNRLESYSLLQFHERVQIFLIQVVDSLQSNVTSNSCCSSSLNKRHSLPTLLIQSSF